LDEGKALNVTFPLKDFFSGAGVPTDFAKVWVAAFARTPPRRSSLKSGGKQVKGKHGAALAGAVVIAALALSGCGAEKFEPKTSGSEDYQKKIESGQPLYTAPQGAMPKTGSGDPAPKGDSK
jgi:hypothetical protein